MMGKPSITVDERGVLLHVPMADGRIFSIALEPATVAEMIAALTRAGVALKTPQGRSVVAKKLGEAFIQLLQSADEKNDGPKEK
jgi:hypothetical protein